MPKNEKAITMPKNEKAITSFKSKIMDGSLFVFCWPNVNLDMVLTFCICYSCMYPK